MHSPTLKTLTALATIGLLPIPAQALPQVIIKADDLRYNPSSTVDPAWQRFVDYIEEKRIHASIGIITESLEGAGDDDYAWIREVHKRGRIEFWNHGLEHIRSGEGEASWWEFRNTDYAYQKEHFATIALGFSIKGHAFNRVASDHYQSMRTAVHECAHVGYRRIAYTDLTHMCERVDDRWLAGYYRALQDHPEIEHPRTLFLEHWEKEAMNRWFERERPDVIITSAPDVMTKWIRSKGLRVPKDVGVVSLSVPSTDDPQTGICQNPAEQAQCAIDLLVDKVSRNETGAVSVPMNSLIEGTWCPGTTVRGG